MTHELVVNIKLQKCEIYIGRKHNVAAHFGNPFSHRDFKFTILVKNRAAAVESYRRWLTGEGFSEVEPDRREWILRMLHTLKGRTLGCYCAPALCHGEVLIELCERS